MEHDAKYVTVETHRGYDIQTLSPAKPGQFGYIIDNWAFANQEYAFVQDAMDAIDEHLAKDGN